MSSATGIPAGAIGCTTASLAVSSMNLGAAAGTEYLELVFKDVGGPCSLQGYPGVSFVDAQGGQVGVPAPRSPGADGPVTLAPGASAVAQLAYHDAYVSTVADCQPTMAVGIRVYPPGETSSVVVPISLAVCANAAANGTADVSPVRPNPGTGG